MLNILFKILVTAKARGGEGPQGDSGVLQGPGDAPSLAGGEVGR